MDSRAPAVVAVIVTTGSGPGLEARRGFDRCSNYEELSLLVVANGDAVRVAERVASVAPRAFVRVLEENRGFGPACNEAALMVEGSAFFLFCHDDVRLEPDAAQLMVEAAFRTNAGIVTPKFVSYEDPLVLLHVGQTSDRLASSASELNWVRSITANRTSSATSSSLPAVSLWCAPISFQRCAASIR